jgi:hypothetical protein
LFSYSVIYPLYQKLGESTSKKGITTCAFPCLWSRRPLAPPRVGRE